MIFKTLSPLSRIGPLATCLILTLSACAKSDSAVLHRQLPPLPAWAEPVTTPEPKTGEDARIVAGRERSAKAKANTIIGGIKDWYGTVRDQYAGKDNPQ